jgi:hypothetical protein
VRARGGDAPVLEHQDAVGREHGADALRHDQARLRSVSLRQGGQGVLDAGLGGDVDRARAVV